MKKITIALMLTITSLLNAQLIIPTDSLNASTELKTYILEALLSGEVAYSGDIEREGVSYKKFKDVDWVPTPENINLIIEHGGDAVCEIILKLPASAMEANVSEVNNSTCVGKTSYVSRTWGTWFYSRTTVADYDSGNVYALAKKHTGELLTLSEIKVLLDLSNNVEVVSELPEGLTFN